MAGDNELTRMQDWVREQNLQRGHSRPSEPPTDAEGWSPPAETPEPEKGPGQPQSQDNLTKDAVQPGVAPNRIADGENGQVKAQEGGLSSKVDPGPVRFVGTNLDERAAFISSGGAILLSEDEVQTIAKICMQALDRHLVNTFTEIGKNHGVAVNVASSTPPSDNHKQMDIFEGRKGKRGPKA